MEVCGGGFAFTIDPAGADSCLLAAQNIGAQAIAYDHCFAAVKAGDPGKTPLKIFPVRLVGTHLLGDEYILEEVGNIGPAL